MRPTLLGLILAVFCGPSALGDDTAPATQPSPQSEPIVRTAPRVPNSGHLVIVGGALDPDHEAIYRAVLDRIGPDGKLGVLPTASGVPEKSGPGTVEDFQRYAGPGQTIELIDLRNGEVEKARDPAWVQRIAECDGLWFTGGDQSRIVATFRPLGSDGPGGDTSDGKASGDNASEGDASGGDTPAYLAMFDLLDRGGVIGGTSAGAAMMSDPMIKWGNSHEALLLGVVNDVPDFGVGVGKGMGFLPYGIVDQHFFRRGRMGRLLVACEYVASNNRLLYGFGVGENCAMVVDLANNEATTVGRPGVLITFRLPRAVFNLPELDPDGTIRPMKNVVAAFNAGLYGDGGSLPLFHNHDQLKVALRQEGKTYEDPTHPTLGELREWISGAPRSYEEDPVFNIHAYLHGSGSDIPTYGVFVNDGVFEVAQAKAASTESLESRRKEHVATQPSLGQ